ncbi:unnamed protein product [Boreogadus saida]
MTGVLSHAQRAWRVLFRSGRPQLPPDQRRHREPDMYCALPDMVTIELTASLPSSSTPSTSPPHSCSSSKPYVLQQLSAALSNPSSQSPPQFTPPTPHFSTWLPAPPEIVPRTADATPNNENGTHPAAKPPQPPPAEQPPPDTPATTRTKPRTHAREHQRATKDSQPTERIPGRTATTETPASNTPSPRPPPGRKGAPSDRGHNAPQTAASPPTRIPAAPSRHTAAADPNERPVERCLSHPSSPTPSTSPHQSSAPHPILSLTVHPAR